MEGAEVTRSGRLFQTRAAVTGKARSLTVGSRVWLTMKMNWNGVADEPRHLPPDKARQ